MGKENALNTDPTRTYIPLLVGNGCHALVCYGSEDHYHLLFATIASEPA